MYCTVRCTVIFIYYNLILKCIYFNLTLYFLFSLLLLILVLYCIDNCIIYFLKRIICLSYIMLFLLLALCCFLLFILIQFLLNFLNCNLFCYLFSFAVHFYFILLFFVCFVFLVTISQTPALRCGPLWLPGSQFENCWSSERLSLDPVFLLIWCFFCLSFIYFLVCESKRSAFCKRLEDALCFHGDGGFGHRSFPKEKTAWPWEREKRAALQTPTTGLRKYPPEPNKGPSVFLSLSSRSSITFAAFLRFAPHMTLAQQYPHTLSVLLVWEVHFLYIFYIRMLNFLIHNPN